MNRAAQHFRRLSFAVLSTAAGLASATTYQVTSLADAGPGSLRQAVLDANANPGPDAIDIPISGLIPLTSGPLAITDSLVLNGPGSDRLAIDGGGIGRILNVTAGPFRATGITFQNGQAPPIQAAGGILANADVALVRCVVRDCRTPLTPGANGDGGGVYVGSGRSFSADACLFLNNSVGLGTGGAIRSQTGATVDLRNCTFSGNSATQGGAVACAGAIRVNFCTFADNQAASAGGAIWTPVEASIASNSIFFRNSAPNGPNWLGGAQSGGFNIVGTSAGSAGWGLTDRLNLDPMLGPLGMNGGGAASYPLLNGSPALDGADPNSAVNEDQRGMRRPQRGQSDVGAFEVEFINQSPIAHAGADQTVPSDGSSAEIQLDGSGSFDPDDDDLTYAWFENGVQFSDEVLPSVGLGNGNHLITLIVTDEWGASSEDQVSIVVEPPASGDQIKPRIRRLRVWPHVLMPANGQMRSVRLNYHVKDNNDPQPQIWLTVESNQPDAGLGPGDRPNDVQIVDANLVNLRAERFGNPRFYTVTVHARDRDGNEAVRSVKVIVPRPWRHRNHPGRH